MICVADESVDLSIVTALRQAGHDVAYVAESSPGASDAEVLRQATDHKALLITADKDFGELIFRQKQVHCGVLLLRLAGLNANEKAAIVSQSFRDHSAEFAGAFTVLSPGLLRIRR